MNRGRWRTQASRMAIIFGVIGLLLVNLWSASAQTAPDYSIRSIRSSFAENGTRVTVIFDVVNNGGASGLVTTARLLDSSGRAFVEAPVPALDQFETAPVRLEFPTYLFQDQAGESVSLTATVGIPDIETPNSANAGDNTARISVAIPVLDVQVPPELDTGVAQAAPEAISLESILRGTPIPLFGTTVDSRVLIAGAVVGLGVLLLLLWVITIILRLLFSRPAVFPLWQPPYTAQNYLDPNSLAGRRTLWQPHAGSDLLPIPCLPGTYAARKLLLGAQGGKLNGWHVTGLRLNQYDMYGRVARSQVIAEPRLVKQLDRIVRKNKAITLERAERRVRPIARRMINDLKKRVNKRSTMLPIALDVRLDGRHGDVRIVFELHQCDGNSYTPIDSWEPEMVVTTSGGMIRENLTYTLFGQRQDERTGAYIKRLRADMSRTLGQMLANPAAPPPPKNTARQRQIPPTPPSTPSVPPENVRDN